MGVQESEAGVEGTMRRRERRAEKGKVNTRASNVLLLLAERVSLECRLISWGDGQRCVVVRPRDKDVWWWCESCESACQRLIRSVLSDRRKDDDVTDVRRVEVKRVE